MKIQKEFKIKLRTSKNTHIEEEVAKELGNKSN